MNASLSRLFTVACCLIPLGLSGCLSKLESPLKTGRTLDMGNTDSTRKYELALEPGEGAILLLGDNDDLQAVRKDYFSRNRKRKKPAGPLDRLLLGFYSGPPSDERAAKVGLTKQKYIARMLKLYKGASATAVYFYYGNMQHQSGGKLADAAAKYGLRSILQTNDLYFRGHHYWMIESYRNSSLKGYADPQDYLKRYLMPRLKAWAPGNTHNSNILAWSPVEELPPEDEEVYAEYKKAFKRLFPNHLLYQLDSQQTTRELLKSKKPPYPDITGFDRYPWWTRPEGQGLWTPHYAARLFFSWIKDYARHCHELFGAPAVLVMQGCGEVSWADEAWGRRFDIEPREDFVSPKSPSIRWSSKVGKFRTMNRYLAPDNAWRLQNWMGIASGFKGLMYWSAGPAYSLKQWNQAIEDGSSARRCLIDDDFATHRLLKEVSASWKEIRRYEMLLLDSIPIKEEKPKWKVAGPHVFTGMLRDNSGHRYLVVVNGLIGQWDGTSPEILNYPKTKLTVGENGELENYTPLTEPRRMIIEMNGSEGLPYDLRTLKALEALQRTR